MDCFKSEDNLSLVQKTSKSEKLPIRVVITEATNYMARSLAYRLLSAEIFGPDQEIILSLYDSSNSAKFLEGVAIEITASAPNLLRDIIYSKDPEEAFKDADIIFSIGKIRDYNFLESSDLHNNPFFKDAVLDARNNAESIEMFAKRNAKIIALGSTTAKIFAEYAPSIPKENITAVTLILQNLAASAIAKRTNKLSSDVKNLIIWGTHSKEAFPYCTYAKFSDGTSVIEKLNDDTWLKKTLPKLLTRVFQKCRYRLSEVLAIADHCKYLMQGTKDGEWISMSVFSDGSYEVKPGVFFSFPVYCNNGKWKIVQGLNLDDCCRNMIKKFTATVDGNIESALQICKQKNLTKPKVITTKRKKSIIHEE